MYLMYVDESGDDGNNTVQSKYFCLSGLVVHESQWRTLVDRLLAYRRTMRDVYGLPLRPEIHSVEFLRKNEFGIEKHRRLAILRNGLDELAKLNFVSLTHIVVDKEGKPAGYDVFGSAWRTLFQRFENTLVNGNFPEGYRRSFGLVFTDATSGNKLRTIMRRMSVYNPIPNRYGGGYRDMPIQRVIEDPTERDSRMSLPIQACDLAAYFLTQYLRPNGYIRKKRASNYFERLQPVLNTKASSSNRLGIVKI